MKRLSALVLLMLAACGGSSSASPDRSGGGSVRLQKVGSFDSPLYVTAPPGDRRRVFVVEQGGKIRVIRGGRTLRKPFLDVSDKVSAGGERGLLSMAFAPDYARSGLFYVDYTDTDGNTRVVEYRRRSADVADPGSARQVLFQRQPESNHNGGLLLFGPDKLLYVGLGDGGGGGDMHGPIGNAQSLGTWLGKILRIDPRRSGSRPYSVPRSNPFVGRAGARPEIYSYGLRNPWRFSFDRRTGDLTIGDVGQNEVEEIDFVRRGRGRGANFGWRVFEGRARYTEGERAPGAIMPVITQSHSDGNCSITGGVVIRDPRLRAWRGRYVFGDLCRGVLQTAVLRSGRARRLIDRKLEVSNLSSFGEDALGRVYAVSLDGPVYRLVQR
ncbi:MAG TPA: PQQ-dependent sugar dehydrogenase [Solirubrobacter sp.]|nr:PQQ-dependent sugar dehydrogenase [Solirubrobacter sp.]